MRIGIPLFGCDGGRSGIGQYATHIIRRLAAQRGQDEIEVLGHPADRHALVPPGVSFVSVPDSLSGATVNLAWHQVVLPALCLKRRYDVLFFPSANRRLPFSVPCPTVGTVHDLSSLHVQNKYDSLHLWYHRQVLPRLIHRLSHVITVSASTRQDVIAFAGSPEDRVTVIHNGYDHEGYHARRDETQSSTICDRYRIRRPYLLYVSRLEHPGKNHIRLLDAFARLKASRHFPHQLVLAGPDRERAEEIHRHAASVLDPVDVVFCGFVENDDLGGLVRAADGVVFPSLFEGFGIPIVEAMASGVPVACSNLSSMPEVAGDAALLFDPLDVHGMTDAMAQILSDPILRQRCVHRGLERSRTFDWDLTAERTLGLLRQVANQRLHVAASSAA